MDLKNSMILANMMSQKQQIMYATIKGTLTESPEGVFSGFSSSNYLNLQENIIYTNNFEMLFKITTGTSGTTQQIFEGSISNAGLTILISSDNKLFVSAGNGNGSWIVNTSGTTILSTNTTYYVKFSYKNNVYKLELSTDNINWNTEISVANSSVLTSTENRSIGYSTRFNSRVFTGSIDLNQSYIKLGSTKYKLQAVVGYTIVGSPTITDGVVSGFQAYPNVNSGYYVKIANFTYNNTFEMKVKIKTDSANFGGTVLGRGNHAPKVGIVSTSFRESNFTLQLTDQNNQSIVNIVNVNYIDSRQLTLNTDYILSLKFTGIEYIITLVDMNGIYYINRVVSSSAKLRVGCLAFGVDYVDVAYSAWSGAIDMNETWIKTDNKLFFNGQQA